MLNKKIMKVFAVLLSGFVLLNVFVVPMPVKAQEIGTYAYEDVILSGTATFLPGDVDITVYTRYNSTTGKYTFLRFTYEEKFAWNYPLASLTSVVCTNYSNGDVITDDIRFTVRASSGTGLNWTEYVTIVVN